MKNTINRIAIGVASGLAMLGGLVASAHAQLSTTTLGSAIDSVNSTTYDYFLVLLAKYWPFVVGALILVGVWRFGRRIIGHFN